jgi:intraflagellar transport protein 172
MPVCFDFNQGLKELATKLSISLLRFVGNIPVDKAFFEAGEACKEVIYFLV